MLRATSHLSLSPQERTTHLMWYINSMMWAEVLAEAEASSLWWHCSICAAEEPAFIPTRAKEKAKLRQDDYISVSCIHEDTQAILARLPIEILF